MNLQAITLDNLHAHPHNSNVMPAELFDKLVSHIARSDRYPPIIVRPKSTDTGEGYEILDGHHRVAALRKLGRIAARCVVWAVDDDEALLLLATLNRLEGTDDPRRRARLLEAISRSRQAANLCAVLPETRRRLDRLLALTREAPRPRPASAAEDLPVPVCFVLLPGQKYRLEARLDQLGGASREEALMKLVDADEPPSGAHDDPTDPEV